MTPPSTTEYLATLEPDRQVLVSQMANLLRTQLIPLGFVETIAYGMIAFVVPLSTFPQGYHCKAGEPLPFVSLANQKNFIALYHMGIYAKPDLLEWFVQAHAQWGIHKLDMGKSCIRFKPKQQIPWDLIASLMSKISAQDWIQTYTLQFQKL